MRLCNSFIVHRGHKAEISLSRPVVTSDWPNLLTQSFGDFELFYRRTDEMERTKEKMKLPTEWCRWLNDEVVITMEFGIRTHIRALCTGIGWGPQGRYCRSFILSD